MSPVLVTEPGELIAAVPAMIGFPPERSLVVVVLRDEKDTSSTVIDAVMRFDLDHADGHRVRAEDVAPHVIQACAQADATEVLMIVVDDRANKPAHRTETRTRAARGGFDELVAAVAKRVSAHDVTLGGAWAVHTIEPTQPWWSLLNLDQRGTLADPDTSHVTLSHVLDGRQIRSSRSELTALVAADTETAAQVAAHLDNALTVAADRHTQAVRRGTPNTYTRHALDYVLWQIAHTESGTLLMASTFANIAAALRDRTVRDAMLALAVGDHAAAAEQLWATLTRVLPGPDRAEAATLLSYSAYVRGDGPLAGVALEAARESDPDHSVAILLETSLHLGIRPEQIRRLAHTGHDAAAALGVELGVPDPEQSPAPEPPTHTLDSTPQP